MAGHQCPAIPPIFNATSGSGHVGVFSGLNTYFSGSPLSIFAIILISDVYGYENPKLRNVADEAASAGFYAIVPDFFHGDPYNPNNTARPVSSWIKDHGTDKGYEEAKGVIRALKKKGFSKIGAAGFCWGGKVAVKLAQGNYIRAGVLLHPSNVTVEDIKGVKEPLAILSAEFDHALPPALLNQFKETLKANKVDSLVKIFPGVCHGWTIKYNSEDPAAVKAAEEAHHDMLAWFKETPSLCMT